MPERIEVGDTVCFEGQAERFTVVGIEEGGSRCMIQGAGNPVTTQQWAKMDDLEIVMKGWPIKSGFRK